MAQDSEEAIALPACVDARERQDWLASLFVRYQDRLRCAVELRLDPRLHTRIDPSDVLQEAFLEASHRLDAYLRRPPMSVFLWLRSLTCQRLWHLHARHLGAQARSARREIALHGRRFPEATSSSLAVRLADRCASPSQVAMQKEAGERVRDALERMEPLDREILALRYFEHLSSAEAAQVLGIGEPAARKRAFRALRRLKEMLGKEADSHG
jgi:RNA polymerase sigma-70 factor (ECF subfamily)